MTFVELDQIRANILPSFARYQNSSLEITPNLSLCR